jgi:hypothetical protein
MPAEPEDARALLRPALADPTLVKRRFMRGRRSPRGVVWFGFRSFWGHMRHFIASAVATEDVDSRDWMTPDAPEVLAERVARVLGAEIPPSWDGTVLGALGRDLWIDYVADTGDDVSVSRAVARLVTDRYELPDPDREGAFLEAPRGDVLVFGGDTAYPVATAQEISNRVLVPFNEALAERDDGRRRVLLGVPGNHDWYDGLDGFARLFRLRPDGDDVDERPSIVGIPFRQLEHAADWARELVMGGKMQKPDALVLTGYEPVQSASYFVLPLTPTIPVFALDRQLRTIDHRQARFHRRWLDASAGAAPWLLLPDPVYAFGAPSPTGAGMVRDLELSLGAHDCFFLSGDIHHYERIEAPGLLHVVAGGGGAFLHPAPMVGERRAARARFPSVAQSRALLWGVPLKLALGRSGFIPHAALAVLYALSIVVGLTMPRGIGPPLAAPLLTFLLSTAVLSLIGGLRKRPRPVVALASAFALLLTALPIPASMGLRALRGLLAGVAPTGAIVAGLLTTMVMVGVGLVGAYLALLTRFGLEETQAFTTLDHPGFKHFLRLRVRADGRGIDGWCIGIVDPLRHGEQPVLVDRFMWRPAACGGALPADRSREHGASDSAETRPLAGSAGS